MKYILQSATLLLIALQVMWGCTKDNAGDEKPHTKGEITIIVPTSEFKSEQDMQILKIQASADWVASVDQPWVEFSPTKGKAGLNEIQIKVSKNEQYDERRAMLSFLSKSTETNLTIVQKQQNALMLTSKRQEVEAKGGVINVEVKANIETKWSIDEDCNSWVKAVGTRGLTSTFFQFKISENESTLKREGKILFKGSGLEEELTIYQQGTPSQFILSKSEFQIDATPQTIVIELKSDTHYEMHPIQVDWMSENKTRALTSYTHYIDVKANHAQTGRDAEIKFSYESQGEKKTEYVKVIQAGTEETVFKQHLIIQNMSTEYTLPIITGQKMEGKVDWGDSSELMDYAQHLKHQYSAPPAEDYYTIDIRLNNAEEVYWENIKGVYGIDFSQF